MSCWGGFLSGESSRLISVNKAFNFKKKHHELDQEKQVAPLKIVYIINADMAIFIVIKQTALVLHWQAIVAGHKANGNTVSKYNLLRHRKARNQ